MCCKRYIKYLFLRDDGSAYFLATGGKDYLLGDLELFNQLTENIITEATSPL